MAMGLVQATKAINAKAISPMALRAKVDAIADTIEPLKAFVCRVNADQAVLESESRVKNDEARPLEGIPVAVKDNFCVRGHPTTCGSKMLENFVPHYDATIVKQLKDLGAYVIGKTNLDEFGMGSGSIDSAFGATKSLWGSGIKYKIVGIDQVANTGDVGEDWIVPGGSSGGSAVAVSAGAAFVGVGSDTGGSVRIPAAWNGLVSLKPGYGSISRHGLIPLVNSLDVPGFMTRSVEDMKFLMAELSKSPKCQLDSTVDQRSMEPISRSKPASLVGKIVGIPQEYLCRDMTSEVVQAWSDVADALESLGATVKPVNLPHTKYALSCYSVLNPCEVASNMARYDGLEFGLRKGREVSTEAMFADTRHHGFNEVVRGRILAGNYFLLRKNYRDYFEQAMRVRRLILEDFQKVFRDNADALITPVTLDVAPTYGSFCQEDNRTQTTKQDYCTQPVNLAGLPAGTVPVRLSDKRGLPISVQVISDFRKEGTVLDYCQIIEDHFKCPQIVVE